MTAASKCTLNSRSLRWRTPRALPRISCAPPWGPFVGEAGTFEVNGNEITMQATVSKNPSAMTTGAVSVYRFRRDGNTLTLTQVRTHAGPSPKPITVTLTRVE